jgi:hypothetical protein
MDLITIDQDERDLLRESIRILGGMPFSDLANFATGRFKAGRVDDVLERTEVLVAVLDSIGWELEDERDGFELPLTPHIGTFLAGARDHVWSYVREEGEGPWEDQWLAEFNVLEAVLDRFVAELNRVESGSEAVAV